MNALEYRQVDVFADAPLAGNGLAVVVTERPLGATFMQRLTCELRQFETIFLVPGTEPDIFSARVFTMEEELPFAGHPSLGAAAVLHECAGGDSYASRLALPAGLVSLESRRRGEGYLVTMNQGEVEFGATMPPEDEEAWLSAFGLDGTVRDRRMPLCVASTGLPYLVLPVTAAGLGRARIGVSDLDERLATIGAKFAYVLDIENREGRTWDNLGQVEDIATGSAAGPVAGLLLRHGLAEEKGAMTIRQGRYVGRPSTMKVEMRANGEILLSGSVYMVARARFDASIRDLEANSAV